MSAKQRAFSLLELMVTLLIAVILISFVIPALQAVIHATHFQATAGEIHQLLRFAKQQAVQAQQSVIVCPYTGQTDCGNDWNSGLTIMLDNSQNRRQDNQDKIIRHFINQDPEQQLISYPKNRIVFNPQGFAQGTTGSLTYCANSEPPTSRVFVVSRVGRIRLGTDSNGNGIHESASGKDAPCPGSE